MVRIVLVVLGACSLWGCGDETPCDSCANCQTFQGVYFGMMQGLYSTCGEASVLDGDVQTDVMFQTAGANGAGLSLKLTDKSGNWTLFEGSLCNTTTPVGSASMAYTFHVSFEEWGTDESVRNSIQGSLLTGESLRIEAVYDILRNDLKAKKFCRLQAMLRAEK